MGAFSAHTDDDLILLISEGNTAAFAEVYLRYWSKLYNSAYKRLRNNELCEEIIQDVFTKLWERRGQISFNTGLSNYLYTAVKYAVIDFFRKELLKQKFVDYAHHQELADNSNEEHILLVDLKQHVEKVIASLPLKCRSVYQLSRLENKSNKEISALLNISEKTVEGHLTNAIRFLKVSLAGFVLLLISGYLR